MKCKSCGQTCFAKADLSTTGWKSISSCCGAEIDLTDDYSNDAMQGCWHRGQQTSGYIDLVVPTLRDLFAMAAMQGMLAHSTRYKPALGYPENWHDALSQEAYEIADAMIAERNKVNP